MSATRDGGGGRRGGRIVSGEERALWTHVTESVEPLGRRRRARAHAAVADEPPAVPAAPPVGERPVRNRPTAAAASPLAHREWAPPPRITLPKPAPPAITAIDRRRGRKLATGQHEIEARIDLHGMHQREAHARLRSFLLGCQARGQRTVLVITGKGAPGRERDTAADPFERREPGVLKRNVPRWLAEPELRAIVVGTSPAAIRHGGEGALYVILRRDRGGG